MTNHNDSPADNVKSPKVTIRAVLDARDFHIEYFGDLKGRRTRKFVFLMIATWANPDGTEAYPSIGTLADKCGLSERGLRKVILWLEAHGLIRVEYKAAPNGQNKYTVILTDDVRADAIAEYALKHQTPIDPERIGSGYTRRYTRNECVPGRPGTIERQTRNDSTSTRNDRAVDPEQAGTPDRPYRPLDRKDRPRKPRKNRVPSSFSSTPSAATAAIGQDEKSDTEHLTEREVKKLTRKIVARCQNQYGITFNEKNIEMFHTELADAPIFPDDAWLHTAVEIAYDLKHADDKGYSFNQANSRIPATIVSSMVGDGTGTETAVDRYYAHKNLPATMARQRSEMRREVSEETAAIEEEDAAGREYEAWLREHPCEQDESGFESSNPAALSRYLLRESLRAGYEEDRVASEKRLAELRAARGAELQVALPEIASQLPVEPEPVAVAEVSQ